MTPSRNQRTTPNHVAFFGTFDTDNYGDCLFPLIAKQQFAKRVENLELTLFSPTSRAVKTADFPKVHAFDEIAGLYENASPTFVIGGGAIVATEHVLFSYPEVRMLYPYSLKCWLLPAMIARAWNCPLVLNAVGLGPFDSEYNALAARYLKRAELCGVRDAITQNFMDGLGVQAELVPDTGILTPELLKAPEWDTRFARLKSEFKLPEKYIVAQASLYLGARLDAFADAVAQAAQTANLPVVLAPICHHLNDIVALKKIRLALTSRGVKSVLIDRILPSLDTTAILSRSELYVGTSLHGALVTLSFDKPFVSFSLPTMKKNRSVLAVLDAEDCLINDTGQLTAKMLDALKGPRDRHTQALARAQTKLSADLDRMARIIQTHSVKAGTARSTVTFSSGEVLCESMKDDLDRVRAICVGYRKTIPLVRRCGAYIVRNNRKASELYDGIAHWAAVRRGRDQQ